MPKPSQNGLLSLSLFLGTLAPAAALAQAFSVTPLVATSGYVNTVYRAIDLNNCSQVAVMCRRDTAPFRESSACIWKDGNMEILPDPQSLAERSLYMDMPTSINDRGDVLGALMSNMMGNSVLWTRNAPPTAFPSSVPETYWPVLDPWLRISWPVIGRKLSNDRDIAEFKWGTLDGVAVDRPIMKISQNGTAVMLEQRGAAWTDTVLNFSVPSTEGRREVEGYSKPGILLPSDVSNSGKALVVVAITSNTTASAIVDMNQPNELIPVYPGSLDPTNPNRPSALHMNNRGMFIGTVPDGKAGVLIMDGKVYPLADLLPPEYRSLIPYAINDKGEMIAGGFLEAYLIRPTPALANVIGAPRYTGLVRTAEFLEGYCARLSDPNYIPVPSDYDLPPDGTVTPPQDPGSVEAGLRQNTIIPLQPTAPTERVEKVKGLPKGLKFDKKRQCIYGEPKRQGAWRVTLKIGKGRAARTSVLRVTVH